MGFDAMILTGLAILLHEKGWEKMSTFFVGAALTALAITIIKFVATLS